jgi:hypothetical protein
LAENQSTARLSSPLNETRTRTMKTSSRSALACGTPRMRRLGMRGAAMAAAWLGAAWLAGCAAPAEPGAAGGAQSANDARALAADLNARLDALRRQQEPASDDVINSLERTLREQREKRAAAGTTAVIPAGIGPAGVAAPTVPVKPAAPQPVVVATASASAKPVHLTKAQARAASAAAARNAASARQSASTMPDPAFDPAPTGTPLPPLRPVEPVQATATATATATARPPISRASQTRLPADELFERARALEVQLQAVQAIALYREASQRGHAPSSQRLMELYADGAPGVARDYRVAVFFKERAVQQGVSFDPVWRR